MRFQAKWVLAFALISSASLPAEKSKVSRCALVVGSAFFIGASYLVSANLLSPSTSDVCDYKVPGYPDLSQKDESLKLFDSGKMACGPCAAANGITWLDNHGFPGLIKEGDTIQDVARAIDDRTLRSTIGGIVGDTGTNPLQLYFALRQYFSDSDYQISIDQSGEFDAGIAPDLEKIKDAIRDPSAVVLLSIGWFDKEENGDLQMTGGHWVTATGYGDRGKRNWIGFQVSDPDDGIDGKPRAMELKSLPASRVLFKKGGSDSFPGLHQLGNGILKQALIIRVDPAK